MSSRQPETKGRSAGGDASFLALGLDFETGEYLLPPRSPAEVLQAFAGLDAALRSRSKPIAGVDFGDLATSGWGVVLAEGDAQAEALLKALTPLLELRREQSRRTGRALDREYRGARGVGARDSADAWFVRRGGMHGLVDPKEVPAYLLLVGSPERISFDFQSELSLERLVGRVWFEDPEDARRWAESVVAAERRGEGGDRATRSASVFAPHNLNDLATGITTEELVPAVIEKLTAVLGAGAVDARVGAAASRPALRELLARSPGLLFTAGHGCGPMSGAPEVLGALVTQDWPGPGSGGLDRGHVLTADDVPAGADLAGLVAVLFACFGAGLPELDPFEPGPLRHPSGPRLSPLPLRLLAQGAQAVVGHVDRAFLASFLTPGGVARPKLFTELAGELAAGRRLGEAFQAVSERAEDLARAVRAGLRGLGEPVDEALAAHFLLAEADARYFQILGDPAARVVR